MSFAAKPTEPPPLPSTDSVPVMGVIPPAIPEPIGAGPELAWASAAGVAAVGSGESDF
jgi:hypothetical protein